MCTAVLLVCASCGSDDGVQVSSESAGGGLRVVPIEEPGAPDFPLDDACFGYHFEESDCQAIADTVRSIEGIPECSEDSSEVLGNLLGEVASSVSRSRALRGPDDVGVDVLRADGVDELGRLLQAARISPSCRATLTESAERFVPCTKHSVDSSLLPCD